MTRSVIFLLKVFVYLHCCVHESKAVSSSLGTKFYFLAPNELESPDKEIFVFLFTLSTREVGIDLTSPWFDGEPLNIHKVLYRLQVNSIEIPTAYTSTQQIGAQFSYKIAGTGKFGVIIFVVVEATSADSFTPLPVEGWGNKYAAWTKRFMPSVQIVTDQVNDVEIRLNLERFTFTHLGRNYATGDVMTVRLREGEAFTLSFCDIRTANNNLANLQGTLIDCTAPCGVVSGNCITGNIPSNCETNEPLMNTGPTGDIIAEMLMPIETFGKEFITLNIIGRITQGEVEVISSEPDTRITSTAPNGRQLEMQMEHRWSTRFIRWPGIRHFNSDKPVSAMYYMATACRTATGRTMEDGDPAMCNLIPIALFYDGYIWSTPSSKKVAPVNYVCLVVKTVDKEHLKFDDLDVPVTMLWMRVHGAPYETGNIHVSPGTHTVYGARPIKFGCYIYGLARYYSYMNPAGFITSKINVQCIPSFDKKEPGDLIDNDCDQSVDEEIEDGIDNDNDNRIDEDLANPPRTNGAWSAWTEWTCNVICHVYRDQRTRLCNNPAPANNGRDCEGNTVEYRDSDCGRNVICPTDCPVGRWDLNCTKSCEHCEDDCNKFLGNCTSCTPGFMFPERSCNEVCPPFTYGKNCEGNCMEKCEAECLDKVNGNCPLKDNPYLKLLWMLLLIPVIALFLFVLRRRQNSSSAPVGEAKPPAEPPAEVVHSRAPSSVPGSVAGGKAMSLVGDLETSV
ncbi:uncharacterized protein LOC131952856 [Physella acuta]|uniref:uncharacterized protein LOC131952856 n=1 Tax=Physella acuta TaxID=109671 RepID=UPI0027DDB449|nr:uncharacterized protein LOC131952856 [Physella acuta]